jgi:hypothetical protein
MIGIIFLIFNLNLCSIIGSPPPKQISANLLLFNSSIISINGEDSNSVIQNRVNWCDITDEGDFFWSSSSSSSSSFFSSRVEYASVYINERIYIFGGEKSELFDDSLNP